MKKYITATTKPNKVISHNDGLRSRLRSLVVDCFCSVVAETFRTVVFEI